MSTPRTVSPILLRVALGLIGVVLATTQAPTALAQQCTESTAPNRIPSPGLIHFGDLPNATVIGDSYQRHPGRRQLRGRQPGPRPGVGSDGINTASDTSDGAFVIPSRPPTVAILPLPTAHPAP